MNKNIILLSTLALAVVGLTLFPRFTTPVHDGINGLQRCGPGKRINCVVDGDTLWLNGQNLRLKGFDTPEPHQNLCGGEQEHVLAHKATERLLATIRINGEDVGDILIREKLARSWPDGREFWCHG